MLVRFLGSEAKDTAIQVGATAVGLPFGQSGQVLLGQRVLDTQHQRPSASDVC